MKIFLALIKSLFKHVVVIDFEYKQDEGSRPKPVCVVATDILTNETKRIWLVGNNNPPIPFPLNGTLWICHYAVAEVSCFIALGWGLPKYIWDTWIENRKLYNGKSRGNSLLDCCNRYHIPCLSEADKTVWRQTIINNFPNYTKGEQTGIIDYCATDITECGQLFLKQLDILNNYNKDNKIILNQALFHGRSVGVSAQVEWNGIPTDYKLYNDFQKYFPQIKAAQIKIINEKYDLYDDNGTLKQTKFAAFIKRLGAAKSWPRTPTGNYKKDERTLSKFASVYPEIADFKAAAFIANANRIRGFQIGEDNRSRASLRLFGQKTGRTNVSTSKNPFGAPRFIRTLIRPDEGKILVYADWKSQEPHIQARLSNDPKLIEAVESGDPYLSTAKLVKAVPQDAIRKKCKCGKDHEPIRQIYKESLLSINYGQTPLGLAAKIKLPLYETEHIHKAITTAYTKYNKWNYGLVSNSIARGFFETKFGWKFHMNAYEVPNPRSLMNWPIQSHGSEMIRRAMIDLVEAGFEVSMIIHDAVLVHMDRKGSAKKLKNLREIMEDAAKKIIGETIPVDLDIIRKNFTQKGNDGKKWEILYEQYLKCKQNDTPSNSVNKTTSLCSHKNAPVPLFNIKYNITSKGGQPI